MASIIVKSGYIKSPEHAANLIDYAGNKMEAQLLYLEDGSIKTINDEKYVSYIATRPGVEVAAGCRHGLFTLAGDADMQCELDRLNDHKDSIKWSQIISLGREDAERTGFDNRQAWQNLIRAKADKIAQAYNIDLKNLVVNAAYHDKDHHPHIHLVFYSINKREGFVPDMTKASEKLKSLMFNEIFKDDVAQLKELKTEQRSELNHVLETSLKRLYSKDYSPPVKLPEMLADLSDSLKNINGKKVYGFLPPGIKDKVNDILEYMVKSDRQLNEIYKAYCDTQRGFVSRYIDDPEKIKLRIGKFQESFLHPGKYDAKTLHNIIIKYAVALDEGKQAEIPTTVQKESEEVPEAPGKIFIDEVTGETGLEPPGGIEGQPAESHTTVQKENGNSNSLWTTEYKNARAYLYGQGVKQDYDKAYVLLRVEAEKGNPLALYDVGFMHLNGLSVEMDTEEAQNWFSKAYNAFINEEKKHNNDYLQYRIGKMHRAGYGVDQDDAIAAEWFHRSANQGNQFAEYSLGTMYYAGKGVEQDYGKALSYYHSSESQGNSFAAYELGRMYEKGTGIETDLQKSNIFFCTAYQGFKNIEARTHDDKIQYRLGKMTLKGIGTSIDEAAAIEYFENSAKLGNTNAQYELAKLWLEKPEYADKANEALEWMGKAADNGNATAQYSLGKLYLTGEKVQQNVNKALNLLNLSADNGNEFAQYTLGKEYLKGEIVQKDVVKALDYLKISADNGNEFAQYTLGKLYLNGKDVSKNITAALSYLNQALAQGNQFAQYTMGRLYIDGTAVTRDVQKGISLLKLSADQGNQFAQYTLGHEYFDGKNVLKNQEIAKSYLTESANQGNVYAQRLLDFINSGHNNMKAAYAAVLLMRQIAYVIGKDARQDNRCYGQAKSFHVSQVRRRFANHKRQVQRNIADDISY